MVSRLGQRARWAVYGVCGLALTIAAALIAGGIYQYVGDARDLRAHPAPGRLVDIGSHRIHLWCIGTGSPVVVLEAGGGGNVLEWNRVQGEVARGTRVCSYDRAGFGWSDAGPGPRSAARIVGELHSVLRTANEAGPYVLVGHSIGGLFIRLFASDYPAETAGLVLVDATHEDMYRRMPAEARPFPSRFVLRMHEFMAVTGLARVAGIRLVPDEQVLSPEARTLAEGIKVKTSVAFADSSEARSLETSMNQVRETRRVFDMPLVVLSRGRYDGLQRLPPQTQEKIRTAWEDMQRDLATVSRRSAHVVVADATHYVHLSSPTAVVTAVQHVLQQAREPL